MLTENYKTIQVRKIGIFGFFVWKVLIGSEPGECNSKNDNYGDNVYDSGRQVWHKIHQEVSSGFNYPLDSTLYDFDLTGAIWKL